MSNKLINFFLGLVFFLTFLFITGLAIVEESRGAQTVAHIAAGKFAWDNAPKDYDVFGLKLDTRCMAAMGTHVGLDFTIGESGLGVNQLALLILRVGAMYLMVPEAEKEDFYGYSFCSMLPDILDKGFGISFLHFEDETHIYNMNEDQTEVSEAAAMLMFSSSFKF